MPVVPRPLSAMMPTRATIAMALVTPPVLPRPAVTVPVLTPEVATALATPPAALRSPPTWER